MPRPLAARPPSGPQVSAPRGATDLPVLGSAVLPAGSTPDPVGAVQVSPPVSAMVTLGRWTAPHATAAEAMVPMRRPSASPAGPARAPHTAVRMIGRPAPAAPAVVRASPTIMPAGVATGMPPGRGDTPRRRWEAAVAMRPLEAPRPLPAPVRAMARAITGWADPPRFTTGPATRHALAAAGALGATTGSVVHLPVAPTGDPASTAVLAHELAHARRPVARPRFLLAGDRHMDHDEREADAVAAGVVGGLRVGGAGAVTEHATQAARAAVIEATAAMGALGATGARRVTRYADSSGGSPAIDIGSDGTGPNHTGPTNGGWATDVSTTNAITPEVTSPGGWATTVTPEPSPLNIDQVVEAVESRLLREVERRGGRWAGVF